MNLCLVAASLFPLQSLLHARAPHTVVPKTMPGAFSVYKWFSMCSVNVSKGGGAGNFPLLAAAAAAVAAAGSFHTDRVISSARLGSALPPVLLCGWAGPTTPTASQSKTGWAVQRAIADEEERLFILVTIRTLCVCVGVLCHRVYLCAARVCVCIVQRVFHRNNISTLKNYRESHSFMVVQKMMT